MQSTSIALTVIFVATTFSKPHFSGDKYEFSVGLRQAGDEEIERAEEMSRGAPDYVFNCNKIYTGDNQHLITQVIVRDAGDGDAYAAIVAGGPGHTFVTMAYTIPRYVQMNFSLIIYGKPLPFRKIP